MKMNVESAQHWKSDSTSGTKKLRELAELAMSGKVDSVLA